MIHPYLRNTQALFWKVLAVLKYEIIMTHSNFYNTEKYSIFAPNLIAER